jgi:phosphatase NudJ
MTIRWKPNATVAAIIERDGKFLLVEETTPDGLRLNNPAGHLDEGESLIAACVRETLEETLYTFVPQSLVGVYLYRVEQSARDHQSEPCVTYLRFAFCGQLGDLQSDRVLDGAIVRTLWLTADEVRRTQSQHRSPMVLRCVEDYLAGQRFDLSLLHADFPVADGCCPEAGAA